MDNNQYGSDLVDATYARGDLTEVREAISLIQGLELSEHVVAYDQIHAKLEQALRSLDGI